MRGRPGAGPGVAQRRGSQASGNRATRTGFDREVADGPDRVVVRPADDEIGRILDLQRSGRQPCNTVVDLLDERIAEIDRTMADLRALRRTMTAARARATDAARSGREAVICDLIEFVG